jgi:hypothetical protein
MSLCEIHAARISSRSLKHLSITDCRSDLDDCRVRVSTPGLVSLELLDFLWRTPFFENMALLESARVSISEYCHDDVSWNYYDSGVLDGANNNAGSDCVLLGGLSSARHLELRSDGTKVCHLSLNHLCYVTPFLCSTIYIASAYRILDLFNFCVLFPVHF